MRDDITIVCVDTMQHTLSRKAIEHTQSIFPCKNVVIFSDQNFYPDATQFVQIAPMTIVDYNAIVLKQLARWVHTPHVLIVQYDGVAVDASNWSEAFLDYDYVGAPWPWIPPGQDVGNGGFSLRSKKLLDFCYNDSNIRLIFDKPASFHEDVVLCQTLKGYCEDKGMRYAPTHLAQKFSREFHLGWEPKFDGAAFGFHGTFNVPHFLPPDYVEYYVRHINEESLYSEQVISMLIQLYKIGGHHEYIGIDLIARQRLKDPIEYKQRLTHAVCRFPHNTEYHQKLLAYIHHKA